MNNGISFDKLLMVATLLCLPAIQLEEIAKFLDNKSAGRWAAVHRLIVKSAASELSFKREVWVDSKKHGGQR